MRFHHLPLPTRHALIYINTNVIHNQCLIKNIKIYSTLTNVSSISYDGMN